MLSSALSIIQPGGRLIKAKQHRIGAHRAGDFEPSLGTVRQGSGRIIRALGQSDALEPVAGPINGVSLRARIARRAEQPKHSITRRRHKRVVLSDQKVFQKCHAGEQPDILKGAGDAGVARDAELRHALKQKRCAVPMDER